MADRGLQTPPNERSSDADVESPPLDRHRKYSGKRNLYRYLIQA